MNRGDVSERNCTMNDFKNYKQSFFPLDLTSSFIMSILFRRPHLNLFHCFRVAHKVKFETLRGYWAKYFANCGIYRKVKFECLN